MAERREWKFEIHLSPELKGKSFPQIFLQHAEHNFHVLAFPTSRRIHVLVAGERADRNALRGQAADLLARLRRRFKRIEEPLQLGALGWSEFPRGETYRITFIEPVPEYALPRIADSLERFLKRRGLPEAPKQVAIRGRIEETNQPFHRLLSRLVEEGRQS